MQKYNLSQHAQDVIKERHILEGWIERVLDQPELSEQDEADSSLEHRLGRISEYGNRVLRVVYNREAKPLRVVTAYFDRKMRDKL